MSKREDERNRIIFTRRRLTGDTYAKIAADYGLSSERIRQICAYEGQKELLRNRR